MSANKKIICLFIVPLVFFLLIEFAQSQTADITLTWSTDTYVPAGYPGRTLPSRGSQVEVVAQIENEGADPQKFAYHWFLNDKFQEGSSGQGKQVFNFNIGDSITKEYSAEVKLFDENGNPAGSSRPLLLKAYPPEIVLKGEKLAVFANQEADFHAQPYFFNIEKLSELSYSWKLGEQEAMLINSATPNIFTLKVGRLPEAAAAVLSVTAVNKTNSLQRARTEITINLIP